MLIIQKPASEANYTKGRAWQSITHVVLHVEAGSSDGTIAWFANPAAHVSAHYSVSKAGQVYQHVKESDTAWANGIAAPFKWADATRDPHRNANPNSYTISIEHEGMGGPEPWPSAQVQASATLIADICKRNKIVFDRQHIVRHSEIYNGHACPGLGCPIDDIVTLAAKIADQ